MEDKPSEKKDAKFEDLVLDLNFVPKWARDEPKITGIKPGRDYDKRGRDDRRGGGRGRRDDRRGGGRGDRRGGGGGGDRRGGGGGRRDGGRREGGGQRRDGDRRGQGGTATGGQGGRGQGQGNQGNRGQRGGNRDGQRDGQRGGQRGGNRRGPREPIPDIGIKVDFLPDRDRLNKVVAVLRKSQRAYSLIDISSRFAEKDEFILAKITMQDTKANKGKTFYTCKSNGVPFLTRNACLQYIVKRCLEEEYEERQVEVPPPTGKFPCVGRCTMNDELIGPPNWHGYREALENLRSKRYSKMSPEAFARKIEQVHDEEVVEQWRASQTKRRVYVSKRDLKELRKPAEKADAPAEPAADAADPAAEAATENAENPAEAAADTTATQDAAAEAQDAAAEAPAAAADAPADAEPSESAEPAADEPSVASEAEAPAAEESPAEETPPEQTAAATDEAAAESGAEAEAAADTATAAVDAPPPAESGDAAEASGSAEPSEPAAAPEPEPEPEPLPEGIKTYSRNEAELEFLHERADRLVKETRKAIFPVKLRYHLEDSALRRTVDSFLGKERRFPLTISFALRPAFRHMRFSMFRAGKSHVFVTAVKPNALKEENVLPEIREVLDYLKENPGCSRADLVRGLKGSEDVDQATKAAVVGPLKWLVDAGHVIEFFDGTMAIPAG